MRIRGLLFIRDQMTSEGGVCCCEHVRYRFVIYCFSCEYSINYGLLCCAISGCSLVSVDHTVSNFNAITEIPANIASVSHSNNYIPLLRFLSIPFEHLCIRKNHPKGKTSVSFSFFCFLNFLILVISPSILLLFQ